MVAHLGHGREEGLKQDGHCLGALGHPGTAGHGLQHLVKRCQSGDTKGLLSARPQFLPEEGTLWPATGGHGSLTLGITCSSGLPGQQSQGQDGRGRTERPADHPAPPSPRIR